MPKNSTASQQSGSYRDGGIGTSVPKKAPDVSKSRGTPIPSPATQNPSGSSQSEKRGPQGE